MGNDCIAKKCDASVLNAANAIDGNITGGKCVLTACKTDYILQNGTCVENPEKMKCTSSGGEWTDGTCTCKNFADLEDGYCILNEDLLSTDGCTRGSVNSETVCEKCANSAYNAMIGNFCDATGKKPTDGILPYNWNGSACVYNTEFCGE